MRIAISAADNQGLDSPISPHFGRCPYYVFVDLDEENKITNVTSIVNEHATSHAPGQLPEYIKQQGADVMISGGMGGRAVEFFHQFDINVATGASGTVQQSLDNYLNGNLRGDAPCAESVEHGH
ncbi:MAG: dinitrogenase iron-molybdenum cofactor biosynthesis protein [Anaerolinea sp. 4484_236]|nr:MAG: dinitrogenase iron-molybdenum cofactor biosynthesis protein [Anaerolinea sp. 4484_236]OQY35113.1 MAG: dinitrogenase iron-molybdenum cofactor biosynthesis protein [Anaerolineaceae bacterium 4572_5.2]